mmetsp:Transcript_10975/g.34934  ORF Transcript_10975/g.34934 Transcript_10975/m.34934 type:complete len:262 (-) Transcript_10975:850-1635(-)
MSAPRTRSKGPPRRARTAGSRAASAQSSGSTRMAAWLRLALAAASATEVASPSVATTAAAPPSLAQTMDTSPAPHPSSSTRLPRSSSRWMAKKSLRTMAASYTAAPNPSSVPPRPSAAKACSITTSTLRGACRCQSRAHRAARAPPPSRRARPPPRSRSCARQRCTANSLSEAQAPLWQRARVAVWAGRVVQHQSHRALAPRGRPGERQRRRAARFALKSPPLLSTVGGEVVKSTAQPRSDGPRLASLVARPASCLASCCT